MAGIALRGVPGLFKVVQGRGGGRGRGRRVQILADGLFHALMYDVAVAALILLWRARHGLAAPDALLGVAQDVGRAPLAIRQSELALMVSDFRPYTSFLGVS